VENATITTKSIISVMQHTLHKAKLGITAHVCEIGCWRWHSAVKGIAEQPFLEYLAVRL
jgi:hypothetical protein